MKMLYVFLLLFPCLCFAQNPATKTLPLNQEMRDQLIVCLDKEAAIEIAETYAKVGIRASAAVLAAYEAQGICAYGIAFVTYTGQVYHAEGAHGFVNVFEALLDGVPIFSPQQMEIEKPIFCDAGVICG